MPSGAEPPSARSSGGDGPPPGEPPIGGVVPVLQTPFDAAGEIDEEALGAEVDWVVACGADGMAVAMVSEILRLDTSERRRLAGAVCALAAGRVPVVVSVGAESTRIAVALAEHAESTGAAAVMAIPPISAALPDAELEGYYDAIAAATRLPLVVQDASGYVGAPIPLAV
ncbi:MAG TPA: dihydrodipicolinate synthase family protein, partial [Acidimicrobiales bacterium]|nr:dihydrodipicolinate synthase family protein [Acidimicrobiales bacterium]